MAEHKATVEWRSGGGFQSGNYSRAHLWRFDGGAEVPGSSSPHVVRPPMSDPAAVDPEEALIASASSCHMLWFLHLARDAGFDVASYRDEASGRLGKDERGKMAFTRILLRPEIEWVGRTEQQLKAEDIPYKAGSFRFAAVGRAVAMAEPAGFV